MKIIKKVSVCPKMCQPIYIKMTHLKQYIIYTYSVSVSVSTKIPKNRICVPSCIKVFLTNGHGHIDTPCKNGAKL